MATIDEILQDGNLAKSQKDTGSPAPTSTSDTTQTPEVRKESKQSPPVTTQQAPTGYEALIEKFMPKPKTQEELEIDKKKYRRNQIINAIGEGVSAIANLYFTTKGSPNMYSGKNNSVDRTRVSYEKMMSDNKDTAIAYLNARINARKADEAQGNAQRNWERTLQRDRIGDERYNQEQEYRKQRDQIGDDRYNSEQEYKKQRDQVGDDRWQKTFDENKRRSDREYNFSVQSHNDNVQLAHERNAATAAKGVRGKQLGFADGGGNQVSIYENVWKGSMQQVYDAMLSDLAPTDETERKRWERQMRKLDTPSKKEDYVKQNWHKPPKASSIMLALSKIDPATMTSAVNDDVIDYSPDDGEIIDYVPSKQQ